MDIFLLIIVCIIGLLLLYVNVYLLALYCHPDDSGFAMWLCKVVVVIGLSLSWAQTLTLSLDVSNTRFNSGFDMQTTWIIIYFAIFITIVFLIPISIFFYESDEDQGICYRLLVVFISEIIILALCILTLFLTYNYLGDVQIPITAIQVSIQNMTPSDSPFILTESITTEETLKTNASIVLFAIGMISLLGYFFLILYGGIGLFALPLDLILAYRIRPVFQSSSQALDKKTRLKNLVKEYCNYARQLQEREKELPLIRGWWKRRTESGRLESGYKTLVNAVSQLEEEYEIFKMELDLGGSNPIVIILKVLMGVILMITTIMWWTHLLLFSILKKNGLPLHPFLNTLFIKLQQYNISFLAVFFQGFFTLYLLWCVTKGNLVFSMPSVFKFHPMKINETWMNSFLVNIVLVLLASVALTHFSCNVFSQYMRLTTIQMLFGIQIQYMTMFRQAFEYQVPEYALFSWSLFAALIQLILAYRKPRLLAKIDDKKKAIKGNYEIELKECFLQK